MSSPSLAPRSPGRTRSVSQPLREGVATDFFAYAADASRSPRSTFTRSLSSQPGYNNSYSRSSGNSLAPAGGATKGRARSGSLVTVTEVGGDEPDSINDRIGIGANHNAAWVNAPGAWAIHPVLIIGAKLLLDAVPGITQETSWTIVTIGYAILMYIMFHHVTGVPFEQALSTGGAYDELTMWEQIDNGSQYTPAKKWLTSVPIFLFLISTHYTHYDYKHFTLNFIATLIVLFPKLPMLHRLRFHFLEFASGDTTTTPGPSRPASPGPRQH